MFRGANFRNRIQARESDGRVARGSGGKDGLKEKKDAAAQYYETVE